MFLRPILILTLFVHGITASLAASCDFVAFMKNIVPANQEEQTTVRLSGNLEMIDQGRWPHCHLAALCKKLNYEVKDLDVNYAKMVGVKKYDDTIKFLSTMDRVDSDTRFPRTALQERNLFLSHFKEIVLKGGGITHQDVEILSHWPAAVAKAEPLPEFEGLNILNEHIKSNFEVELSHTLLKAREAHESSHLVQNKVNDVFQKYFGKMEFSPSSLKLKNRLRTAQIEEFQWDQSLTSNTYDRKWVETNQVKTRFGEDGKVIKDFNSKRVYPSRTSAPNAPMHGVTKYDWKTMSEKIVSRLEADKPLMIILDIKDKTRSVMLKSGDLSDLASLSGTNLYGDIESHQMLVVGARTEIKDGVKLVTGLEILNSWEKAPFIYIPFEKLRDAHVSFSDIHY
jgi:hypothetical protein